MNLNNKEYSKIRKDMETDEIWDLCIILEEITGKSHRGSKEDLENKLLKIKKLAKRV